MSTINEFRAQLERGGHRSNRFKVIVDFPQRTLVNAEKANTSFEFLCFASSMPKQDLGDIALKFRGRTVYLAGDPADPEVWTCQVYNSITFDIRNACINWRNNYIKPDSVTGEDLIDLSVAKIYMLDKDDNPIQSCELVNAWCKEIGSIETSWKTENEISTFQLGMRYDYLVEVPVSSIQNNTLGTIEGTL